MSQRFNMTGARSGRLALIIVGLMMGLASSSLAQGTGIVKGKVVDRATGDPLPGANVTVVGTSVGSATAFDGTFILRGVSAGTRKLKASYIGYKEVTADVTVVAEGTLEYQFRMTAEAIEGETVVVTAQARGQNAAINQQLASNNIVNVVSAEKMKELPDANIAESIGRLPGISLQRNAGEAYAVVVRGLSPKYNLVTIEGVPMTSTNYYDRGIDLSLLSDDVVRGVEVSKTLRPDLDADALGGTVNLTLKSADPGFHFNVLGNGAYNNLRDTYKSYKFAGSVSDRFLGDQFGVLLQGNVEQKQLPSDQFAGSYDGAATDPVTLEKYITTNNSTLTQSNLTRHRYGVSAILDYTSDLVDIKFYNVYDQKRDSSLNRTYNSGFSANQLAYNIYANETRTEQRTHSLSALFKLGGTELPMSISYTKGNSSQPDAMEFDFLQTAMPAISLGQRIYGDPADLIPLRGPMDPNSANSTFFDMKITNSLLTDESFDAKIDWKVPFRLSDSFSGKLSVGAKTHGVRRTSDQDQVRLYLLYGKGAGNRVALVNTFPFLSGLNPAASQAGILAYPFVDPVYKTKSILGYPIGPGFNSQVLIDMQNEFYFNQKRQAQYDINGQPSYNQFYVDNEHTAAGYIMGEFNIGSELTVVPGVRYQQEVTDIRAYHVKLNGNNQNGLAGEAPALVESKRITPNWYPSVNIKYRLTENIQVVGAAFKSVSLPSFAEISPLVEYDVTPAMPYTGNPFLRPSTAWNFDLGASLSSNDIGLVTVNLFYKEISDLIYYMNNYAPFNPWPVIGAPADIWDRLPGPGSTYYDQAWATNNRATTILASIPMNDPNRAFLRGVEISWQTHLWYLPGLLGGIVLDLNASYMSSRQYYPSFTQVNIGSRIRPVYQLVYGTVAGPLQDQPKATYNAILGWDYLGFSSRFSLRYQQLTSTSIDTQFGLQNSYYDDVLLLDISLKQQLLGNLSVFANASNINGHIDNYYYSHPGYQTHALGDLPTSKQTYGWALQMGVTFSM